MKIVQIEKCPNALPVVAKWLYDQWGHKRPDGSLSRSEKALMTVADESGLPKAFIAMEKDAPVGVARLVRYDMENRKELSPWLASVYTPVEHRHRGIATALCKQVVDEAYTSGFPKLYLFTPDRETFYLRQGWQPMERTLYRGENIVIMEKQLR